MTEKKPLLAEEDGHHQHKTHPVIFVLSRMGMLAALLSAFINAFSNPDKLDELPPHATLDNFYHAIGEEFLDTNKILIVFQLIFMLGMSWFWLHELGDTEEDILPKLVDSNTVKACKVATGIGSALPIYATINGGKWLPSEPGSAGAILAAGCASVFFAQLYGAFLAFTLQEKTVFAAKEFLHDHSVSTLDVNHDDTHTETQTSFRPRDFWLRWIVFTTLTTAPQLIISIDTGTISAFIFAVTSAALESAFHASHDVVAGKASDQWKSLKRSQKGKALFFCISHGSMAISTTMMFASRTIDDPKLLNKILLAFSIIGIGTECWASFKEAMIHAGEHHHHHAVTPGNA